METSVTAKSYCRSFASEGSGSTIPVMPKRTERRDDKIFADDVAAVQSCQLLRISPGLIAVYPQSIDMPQPYVILINTSNGKARRVEFASC